MKNPLYLSCAAAAFLPLAVSCIKTESVVEVKPMEMKITMDVRVDRELKEAFSEPVSDPDAERAARRERFKERKPKLDAWKEQGVVKETGRGFVRIADYDHAEAAAAAKAVEAENADRTAVFQVIAKKEDTTVDFVGRRWAAKMAEKTKTEGTEGEAEKSRK